MAHKVIDRCKETTSTTGTGNLTLTGAASGFVTMASALTSNGDTSWFCAESGAQWEVFLGTRVSATELARTTLLASSTGSAVNFSTPPTVFSTIPAAKMAPAGGPAFSATRASSTQAVTASSWAKVQLNSEVFDTASCFDSTTDHRFTPNAPGYYQISFSVEFTASSGMTGCMSAIYKNGTIAISGNYSTAGGSTMGITSGCGLIYMNGSTDYVELFGFVTGSNTAVNATKGTHLSGFLARAE